MAEDLKAKGNAAYSSGDYTTAVKHFTNAIIRAPTSHVLFSNRSAAQASRHNYEEALKDVENVIALKPDWGKGYNRLGAAYLGLNRYEEAVEAYTQGLEIDPNNEFLKTGLVDAKSLACRPRAQVLVDDAFREPDMWFKVDADVRTREFMKEWDFVNKMKEIQRNPRDVKDYVSDKRVLKALEVLLNVEKRRREAQGDETKEFEEDEMMDVPSFGDEKERKQKAQKEKELGNAAYQNKEFESAIKHYSKAMKIDDEDICYLTNRAAVHMEMGKYDECINACEKAVERGREVRSDYKMIAKCLTRKGTALGKLAKSSKDYETVIETYQKALTES